MNGEDMFKKIMSGEDQSILGRTIIFVGLAEGIAIFGVIISILILNA